MMENKEILKKKKKRLEFYLEMTDEELIDKIVKILKSHIGREKAIHFDEMFVKVFQMSSSLIDYYKLVYYSYRLRRALHKIRKRGIMVVSEENYIYILKTKEELKTFHLKIDDVISGLKEMKKKSSSWVRNSEWKNL